jgi:hypothetical protein
MSLSSSAPNPPNPQPAIRGGDPMSDRYQHQIVYVFKSSNGCYGFTPIADGSNLPEAHGPWHLPEEHWPWPQLPGAFLIYENYPREIYESYPRDLLMNLEAEVRAAINSPGYYLTNDAEIKKRLKQKLADE